MKIKTTSINLNDSEILFHYREESEGDKGVIQQVFKNNDYDFSIWKQGKKLLAYHLEQAKIRPSLIIDAGANIGAATVYFSKTFSNSLIFAIEPEVNNCHLLNINTKGLNVFNFHGAIADVDGELIVVDPGISDWGFRTRPVIESEIHPDTQKVKSISTKTILSHAATKNTNPLILKIDIEGGEDALFRGDSSWLDKFPLVIIELHDWLLPFSGSSRSFIKAIAQHDFDVVYRGENIFLFNRRILGE